MNDDDLEPQVTGLSPKEGKEGTKIIIRGQNLGKDKHDLKSNVGCFKLECRTNEIELLSYQQELIVTPLLLATYFVILCMAEKCILVELFVTVITWSLVICLVYLHLLFAWIVYSL